MKKIEDISSKLRLLFTENLLNDVQLKMCILNKYLIELISKLTMLCYLKINNFLQRLLSFEPSCF